MPARPHPPEWIFGQLNKLLLHGARAATLVVDAPELVGVLVSSEEYPDLTDLERAVRAERIVRTAVAALEGVASGAVAILLALAPVTLGMSLGERREKAGKLFKDIHERAFKNANNEGMLLTTLALEIHERVGVICPCCGLPCGEEFPPAIGAN